MSSNFQCNDYVSTCSFRVFGMFDFVDEMPELNSELVVCWEFG